MSFEKRKHIYAGACPICQSKKTGRVEYGHAIDEIKTAYKVENKAMQRGDLVLYTSMPYDVYKTAYCSECGAKWLGEFKTYSVTDKEWYELTGIIPIKYKELTKTPNKKSNFIRKIFANGKDFVVKPFKSFMK